MIIIKMDGTEDMKDKNPRSKDLTAFHDNHARVFVTMHYREQQVHKPRTNWSGDLEFIWLT